MSHESKLQSLRKSATLQPKCFCFVLSSFKFFFLFCLLRWRIWKMFTTNSLLSKKQHQRHSYRYFISSFELFRFMLLTWKASLWRGGIYEEKLISTGRLARGCELSQDETRSLFFSIASGKNFRLIEGKTVRPRQRNSRDGNGISNRLQTCCLSAVCLKTSVRRENFSVTFSCQLNETFSADT